MLNQVLVYIIVIISTVFVSMSFWLSTYQFIKNKHNHIYSLNIQLSLIPIFILLVAIIHMLHIQYFTAYHLFALTQISYSFILFQDISLLSKYTIYNKLYEFILKMLIAITFQIFIIYPFNCMYIQLLIILIGISFLNTFNILKYASTSISILRFLKFILGSIFIFLLFMFKLQYIIPIYAYTIFLGYSIVSFIYYYDQIVKNMII